MRYGARLEWWDTPLSDAGYQNFFVTQGSWENDRFFVPISCSRPDVPDIWDTWVCSITKAVWVRVIADEFFSAKDPVSLPPRPFRAPFYRVVGSEESASYQRWLRETRFIREDQSLYEYLIASMENEVHLLAMDEPTFARSDLGPGHPQAVN